MILERPIPLPLLRVQTSFLLTYVLPAQTRVVAGHCACLVINKTTLWNITLDQALTVSGHLRLVRNSKVP